MGDRAIEFVYPSKRSLLPPGCGDTFFEDAILQGISWRGLSDTRSILRRTVTLNFGVLARLSLAATPRPDGIVPHRRDSRGLSRIGGL